MKFLLKKGFTLVEVLVVLILISLLFSFLFIAFFQSVQSSLNIEKSANQIKKQANLYWFLEKLVYTAQNFSIINGTAIYFKGPCGLFHKGIVKCALIYKKPWLYYYEYPYYFEPITDFRNETPIKLERLEKLSFLVKTKEKILRNYEGALPDFLIAKFNDTEMIFKFSH